MKLELLALTGGYARQGLRYYYRVGYTLAHPWGRHHARRVPHKFAEGYCWRKRTAERKVRDLQAECLNQLRAADHILVGHPKEDTVA